MKITEHEMRGLLAGKCVPGDMRVNEELPAYLVRKFAVLQQKLDAVVAENSAIKTMNDVLSEELRGYESDGAYDGPIAHKLWHSNSETPATDACLNSVRAEGIEILTGKLQQLIDEGTFDAKEIGVAAGAVHEGAQIAAQLRTSAPKGDSDEA